MKQKMKRPQPDHVRQMRPLVKTVSAIMWKVAPETTMNIITNLFFKARNRHDYSAQDDLLQSAEAFEISVLGKSVRAWKWGSGPIVLLAHGWASRGIRLAPFVGPLVEAGYTAVTFDSLAHGESEGKTTNFFEFVATINAVSHHVGDVECVIGHSMGAAAAMNLAQSSPKFVFIAPLYDVEATLFNWAKIIGIHGPPFRILVDRIEKRFGKKIADISPVAISPGLSSDVLIIHDEKDRTIPFHHSETLAGNVTGARLVKTSGLGHSRILGDKGVIEKVMDHVKRGATVGP